MSLSRRAYRPAGPPKAKPVPTPPPTKSGCEAISGLQKTIVLVGPMAAGKTSLGKRLAKELGLAFTDSDAKIQQQHGSITSIFEEHGEPHFREIEAEVIANQLAIKGPRVLALGGGAVLTDSTRELLKQHPVILLMSTQEAVLKTVNIQRRPLLRDDPTVWQKILDERREFYEEVADVTFRTDRFAQKHLTEVAAKWVIDWVKENRKHNG